MINIDKDILTKLDFKNPAVWAGTWFGCGLMKPGPGTWGTIGAMPFGILLLMGPGIKGLIVATLLVSLIGYWASNKIEEMTGEHDLGMIVIDEVAGVWIALLAAPLTPIGVLLAFILFRVLDIFKPWPVGMLDKKLKGGAGVMLDDIAAGIMAAAILWGLNYAGLI